MINDIPTLFTNKKDILTYDFNQIDDLVGSDIDHYEFIDNLSVPDPDKTLSRRYFKKIMLGKNHYFIQKTMEQLKTTSNICLPLLHQWLSTETEKISQINNLVIINDPNDAFLICKNHIKKAPIFKSFLYDSIISTSDNDDWKEMRGDMNMAFIPSLSLKKKVFPISLKVAEDCVTLLQTMSHHYTESVNMSEFFLNETMKQLQKGMFGFSTEFEQETNKKIRDAFSGINIDYTQEFSIKGLQEIEKSKGPLSKILDTEVTKKNIGNILIFAFAGHDTTGHTLTWLLYELCKNPIYKQRLIKEIDEYWSHHDEPTYDTLHELPFMTKCITETLRLWPALANGTYRELEHDEVITGTDGSPVTIKKGTYCQIINWTRHRSEELWGSDVNTFNPNREFKDEEIWSYKGFGTTNQQSDRFSPFTYGPRNCVGKNFSHMEMRLILLYIFKDHDFYLSQEQEKVDVHSLNLFTMGPQSMKKNELLGLYVNVVPRKSRL